MVVLLPPPPRVTRTRITDSSIRWTMADLHCRARPRPTAAIIPTNIITTTAVDTAKDLQEADTTVITSIRIRHRLEVAQALRSRTRTTRPSITHHSIPRSPLDRREDREDITLTRLRHRRHPRPTITHPPTRTLPRHSRDIHLITSKDHLLTVAAMAMDIMLPCPWRIAGSTRHPFLSAIAPKHTH